MLLARISQRLTWIRIRRFLASLSDPILPLLAVSVSIIGIAGKSSTIPTLLPVCLLVFVLFFWVLQGYAAYVRKIHDPDLVMKLQSDWDSADGYARRQRAGKTLRSK